MRIALKKATWQAFAYINLRERIRAIDEDSPPIQSFRDVAYYSKPKQARAAESKDLPQRWSPFLRGDRFYGELDLNLYEIEKLHNLAEMWNIAVWELLSWLAADRFGAPCLVRDSCLPQKTRLVNSFSCCSLASKNCRVK